MATKNPPNRATTFIVIFFGSNIVKHLGWRIGALATPGTAHAHPYITHQSTHLHPVSPIPPPPRK